VNLKVDKEISKSPFSFQEQTFSLQVELKIGQSGLVHKTKLSKGN